MPTSTETATTTPTTVAELDQRYGRGKSKRTPWILGGLLAIAFVGYLVWVTLASSWDAVDFDDRAYSVLSPHAVQVEFQFVSPPNRPVFCALQALDPQFGVVGWKVFEYPASPDRMRHAIETIPTVAEATTGLVNSCWVE